MIYLALAAGRHRAERALAPASSHLSLNYGAYLAETIRSGIISAVPWGQREAAMCPGGRRACRIGAADRGAPGLAYHHPTSRHTFHFHAEGFLAGASLMGLWKINFLAQSYGRATYRYMEMLVCGRC